MKPKTMCHLIAFLIVVHASFALEPARSQGTPEESHDIERKLARRITTFKAEGVNFLEALHDLARNERIPMGVEWVKTPTATSTLELKLHNASVQQVLDALVRTQPSYEWQLEGGLVHVFPRALMADRHNFLNLHIRSFTAKEKELPLASRDLRHEVQRLINPELYKAGWGGHTAIGAGEEKKLSVELRDATVRQILDALVLAHQEAIWIVTFPAQLPLDRNGYRAVTFPHQDAVVGTRDGLWLLVPLSWKQLRTKAPRSPAEQSH